MNDLSLLKVIMKENRQGLKDINYIGKLYGRYAFNLDLIACQDHIATQTIDEIYLMISNNRAKEKFRNDEK